MATVLPSSSRFEGSTSPIPCADDCFAKTRLFVGVEFGRKLQGNGAHRLTSYGGLSGAWRSLVARVLWESRLRQAKRLS